MNMYICRLSVTHPKSEDLLIFAQVVIASDKDDALVQAESEIREREFVTDMRDFVVESSSATEIDRELIEQAAIQILGWTPPAL